MRFDETLTNCVRKDLDVGNIVMLLGEPGIGKSSWTENLAYLDHTKCFTLACNQLADKADLTGARLMPYTDPDGNEGYKQCFFPHAVIMDAVDYANTHPKERPILFLDEINRTNADVTSELLSIPTLRSLGNVSLPDNLIVMCAGNDKGNVTSLDEASISRFVLYHVQPDVATFLSLDPDLNPFVKNVLERHPETLFCKEIPPEYSNSNEDAEVSIEEIIGADDGMAQLTTPRTLSRLSNWLNKHSRDELLALSASTYETPEGEMSALQEQIEAHVGRTPFSVYLLAEISDSLVRNDTQTTGALSVPKPRVFDDMLAATTIDQLNDIAANMSDEDRSACMVYALADENVDHRNIIRALAPITNIVGEDLQHMMQLASFGRLDDDNVATLLAIDCPFVEKVGTILRVVF